MDEAPEGPAKVVEGTYIDAGGALASMTATGSGRDAAIVVGRPLPQIPHQSEHVVLVACGKDAAELDCPSLS